jgi:DNA-binding transcriptional ArsR family regulator
MDMADKCCQKGSGSLGRIRTLKGDLEILGDENRLRILCLIRARGELCVCEIFDVLGLPQNLASYHLGKLKEAGFLKSRKSGVKVLYRQGKKKMENFRELIKLII